MYGRLNVIDCPEVIDLCGQLGIALEDRKLKTGHFISAASTISIVLEKKRRREFKDVIWWLLLEQTDSGFKPSVYTSFNTVVTSLMYLTPLGITATVTSAVLSLQRASVKQNK